MPNARPEIWLVRHGATEWSKNGNHTSVTDLPLLPEGRDDAQRVGEALKGVRFDAVLSSPRQRAVETARGAGFPDPQLDEDLVEWAYGPGEGLTTPEIREVQPEWRIWTHGSPGFDREGYPSGESVGDVTTRLGRVIDRVLDSGAERTLVFGHGHSLRSLAMVWLGFPVSQGEHFPMATGTVSVLGWEKESRALVRWNTQP